MAQVFKDFPGRAREHGSDCRALQRRPVRHGQSPAQLRRPGRLHARRRISSTSCARASRQRLPRLKDLAAAAASSSTRSTSTSGALSYEIEMIKQMKYPGYFLITWDFIRYAREQGIPVGPGPRIGGRQLRRLLPAHHRRRSDRVRPDLRALPESRARVAAGHRHRLLRTAARRSDRLRHAEVRARRTSRRSSRSAP